MATAVGLAFLSRAWPRKPLFRPVRRHLPLQAALRNDPQLFRAVFEALREIDTAAFIREGRVYGGGLYKMEPKELGRLDAEPVVAAMGGWKQARQKVLFVDA